MNKRIIKFISCIALLLVAYIPTIAWMLERWLEKESYYGHGLLIPLVSLFIAWQRRESLRKIIEDRKWKIEDGKWTMGGLWIVIAALLIHMVCAALKVYFVSGFSFVIALYGLIMFFFGREVVRKVTFPIFFLFTMIPLPLVWISGLTVQLKLFATHVSTFLLNRIGFPSVYNGNLIIMPNSRILIEAPCSGLRSLISLLTLGILFAYMLKGSLIRKILLFLSSIPIAMVTNIARILLLAMVNDLYGEKITMGFVHDASGFMVFGLAFAMLMGAGKLLEYEK